MIYRLEIENFFCFRDRQTLDLTVPRSVPDEQDGRLAPIFHGSDLRMPKVVVAFGANGSGKSTVLKALTFLFGFISESFRNERFSATHCLPFNTAEDLSRPTRMAMECGGGMTLSRKAFQIASENPSAVPQGTYRYEIALEPAGASGMRKVLSEALKQRPAGRGKWTRVFERDGEGRVVGSKNFPLAGYAKVVDKLPHHASLIPTLAGFQHEPSQVLLDFVRRGLFTTIYRDENPSPGVLGAPNADLVALLADQPKVLEALNAKIREIDIGVEEVAVRQQVGGAALFFKHSGLEREMSWSLESTGTRSFISDFPYLYAPIMQRGGISVVDEPDHAVHPIILLDMLDWYRVPDSDSKPARATPTWPPLDWYRAPDSDAKGRVQLWMSCQTPTLMDDLAKEEIVLCEKRLDGSAEVFPLAGIKGVRRDDNYRKKYLSGIYGAIPQLG